MQAAIYEKYGSPEVVHIKEIDQPVPRDNEILVQVHATSIRAGDVRMRSFNVPPGEWLPARLYLGVFRPRRKILGMELAGEVAEIGKDVRKFKAGEHVFATTELDFGGHAQYKCLRQDSIVAAKPANLSFEEAAAVPTGGLGALVMIRDKAEIQAGQRILVFGASGSVGSYAVQIAKYYGAEVTGVCRTDKVERVKAIGLDRVIDYTQEDYAAGDVKYDCIFDAAGNISKSESQAALKPNGKFVSIHTDSYKETAEDLDFLRELVEAGHIRPVIDRTFSLDQIVEAYRYAEQRQKVGNVIVTVDHDDT